MDVKHHVYLLTSYDIKGLETERQETELRSCVKVEVDVQGSPSLTVLMIYVDVKQH